MSHSHFLCAAIASWHRIAAQPVPVLFPVIRPPSSILTVLRIPIRQILLDLNSNLKHLKPTNYSSSYILY
jgi:hypothetical protein